MHDVQAILRDLKSSETEVLREAAFNAAEARCEEAVPLLAKLLESDNLGVQEAGDMALRKIGGAATVHHMIPMLRADEAPLRNMAMDILREVGGDDVPSLVALLRDEDPDLRIFASDIVGTLNTIAVVPPLCEALLKDHEVNVRYQAAVSLGNLPCPEAARCLNKALNDDEWVVFAVIEALTKIRDESSIAALAQALDRSTDLVASMIVEALGEMGSMKAATLLLRRLDASPKALRNKMVKAVVQIMGPKTLSLLGENQRQSFRDYLMVALNDEDESIQDAAVTGLASVGGEEASAAVLALAKRLDPDREPERFQATIDSLAMIGYSEALESAVRNGPELETKIAVRAMAQMKTCVDSNLLMEVFWDKDRDIQRLIIEALAQACEEWAKDFFLDVISRHNDGPVLQSAMSFLGDIRCHEAVGQLFTLLEHPFDEVKEAALEAIIAIGDGDVVERFRGLIHSPEPIQRMMAVYAMGKLGGKDAQEELRIALEDEIPDIRKIALEGLFGIVGDSPEGLDLVVSRLSDENREVRLAVIELLGHSRTSEAESFLLQAVNDDDDWVRLRAVEALGERRAKSAVSLLVSLLDNDNPMVLIKVVEALGRIGGQGAFRALMGMVDHPDYEVQTAVSEAISEIQNAQDEEM